MNVVIKITAIYFTLILNGCAVNNSKFFSDVYETDDITYGYTAENPICIRNFDLKKSIDSSYYFLSRLRTKNGNKLKVVERYSVGNPNYKAPHTQIFYNRLKNEPINRGNGILLDLYFLEAEDEPYSKTISIYINPYLKDTVKIPHGLTFEK